VIRKSENLVKLITKFTLTKEIADKRMSICKQCEHLKAFNRCDICGCFMDGKTLILSESCPIDKWKEEQINMDEKE
jgi:recombinational DNA repair protein RecR